MYSNSLISISLIFSQQRLWKYTCPISRVPTTQEKQGKWPKQIPVTENTGNLDCSSCKFPDSIFAVKISFFFFLKLEKSAKSGLCM